MCKFCDPILGPGGLPHTEESCALKQSAYCPLCGPSLHFAEDCPNRSNRRLTDRTRAIPTAVTESSDPYIVLANKNTGYAEFLKQHELQISKKIQENRARVKEHFASREPSLEMVEPPKPLKPSTTKETPACGCKHGANEYCVPRPLKSLKLKKK
jgi:hypothetical protein